VEGKFRDKNCKVLLFDKISMLPGAVGCHPPVQDRSDHVGSCQFCQIRSEQVSAGPCMHIRKCFVPSLNLRYIFNCLTLLKLNDFHSLFVTISYVHMLLLSRPISWHIFQDIFEILNTVFTPINAYAIKH
jgi:hypothetical protein